MLDVHNQTEDNPRKFSSFMTSKKKENSGFASLMKNGTVHSDSQAKADILNIQLPVFTGGDKSNAFSLGMSPYKRIAECLKQE